MTRFKFYLALFIGKLTALFCRLFPAIGGTALPGLIALKIQPQFLSLIRRQNHLQSLIITGTNGKTTTSRLLTHFLSSASTPFIQNRTGSNLLRGLASSLLAQASLSGRLPASLAVWEVDEAVVPAAVKQLQPRAVIFTNLFRDQLDRYGEIDTVLKNWQQALKFLPKTSRLIVNLDDPSLNYLLQSRSSSLPHLTFGLNLKSSSSRLSHTADALFCPHCSQPLKFDRIFTSHLGHYHCPHCSFHRSQPDLSISLASTSLIKLHLPNQTLSLKPPLPGLFNLYNLLAAVAATQVLKLPPSLIQTSLSSFQSAFGRAEKFPLNSGSAFIFLVKNPAGFNAVLNTLKAKKHLLSQPLLIAINDLIADGTDVSWLWDVDFELLNSRQQPIIVSGLRAKDMALRLKYAGLKPSLVNLQPKLSSAFRQLQKSSSSPAYILPTYTAMLSLRELLRKKKIIHSTWKD